MLYIKPVVLTASGCHHSLGKVKLLSRVRLFATPWIVAHRIFQARVLGWVAISFSRGSSRPSDQTPVSRIAGRVFTSEPPGNSLHAPLVLPHRHWLDV